MLIATSVVSTAHSRLRARWKLEGGLPPISGQAAPASAVVPAPFDGPLHWKKDGYRLPPDGELQPSTIGSPDFCGLVQVYDWQTSDVVWRSDWKPLVLTPFGLSFSAGECYVADLEGPHIFVVDFKNEPGRLLRRSSHPYLNDVHSIECTERSLLVTSSGVDAVLELDLQGNLLWEWWAAEHGYTMTPAGIQRESGRGSEHRDHYYHTRFHATHINSAVIDGADDRYVLALLFHQGQLLRIDRTLPLAKQRGEIVLDGLMRPHSLERTPSGWLFANSVGGELLMLDANLRVTDRIRYDGGWIQDCTRLRDGRILLNDVDQHRIVEYAAGPPWHIQRIVPYDDEWRMAELVELPAELETAFRSGRRSVRDQAIAD